MTGDGCSPFCRLEPVCPPTGGACATACGDGLLLPIDKANGQECDDGNTVGGDGCSATCKVEPGFTCTDVMVEPEPELEPAHRLSRLQGLEGGGRTPRLRALPGQWRRRHRSTDAGPERRPRPRGGVRALDEQPLPARGRQPDLGSDGRLVRHVVRRQRRPTTRRSSRRSRCPPIAGGAFQYSNEMFFPLDGLPNTWGNTPTWTHNYGFTSAARTWFQYSGVSGLTFVGDDDVWVFVNKKLAVDLGGTHQRRTGSVTLDAANGHGYVCDFVAPGTGATAACDPVAKTGGHDRRPRAQDRQRLRDRRLPGRAPHDRVELPAHAQQLQGHQELVRRRVRLDRADVAAAEEVHVNHEGVELVERHARGVARRRAARPRRRRRRRARRSRRRAASSPDRSRGARRRPPDR